MQSYDVDRILYKKINFTPENCRLSLTELKQSIKYNSSLQVNFGWSFETISQYEKVMSDCIEEILPKYNVGITSMIADYTASWLGFLPFNVFESIVYEHLSPASMILFNNEMIDFQYEVIKFISNHIIYKQHSVLKNNNYRFLLFKHRRKNRDLLSEAYQFYIQAMKDIYSEYTLSKDFIDEQIGCHFLCCPDLYSELLGFSILKGEVYE